MAQRFTNTEKWKDAWFVELSNDEKLFFYYLIDNVDNAGFLEISFRKIKFDLQISQEEILGAIKELGRGLIFFNEGLKNNDVIYLKNFLKHQKNYPLNPFNSFHNHALKIFEERFEMIEKSEFLQNLEVSGFHKKNDIEINTNLHNYIKTKQGLASPIVKGIVKGEGEGKGKGIFEKSEKLLNIEVDSETILNISKIKEEIKKEFTWKETICRNIQEVKPSFKPGDFENYLEQFFKQIENDGEETKTIQDTKKHFSRWLNIEIKKIKPIQKQQSVTVNEEKYG